MTILLNLAVIFFLIAISGVGGYLLARSQFAATLSNSELAHQNRIDKLLHDRKTAREARDHAEQEVRRLADEVQGLSRDLERARARVYRYEVALFEGYATEEAAPGHDPLAPELVVQERAQGAAEAAPAEHGRLRSPSLGEIA